MLKKSTFLAWFAAMDMPLDPTAQETDLKKFGIEIEGGPKWQSRNDVRVPNDTGTKFSMRDLQGKGPFGTARVYFDYSFAPRHEFRLLAAPLSFTSPGTLPTSTSFAGKVFAPGRDVVGTHQFDSYRMTCRYRFYESDHWAWKIGVTGKIRDAKIELRQGSLSAIEDNVGFVPLLHLDGEH